MRSGFFFLLVGLIACLPQLRAQDTSNVRPGVITIRKPGIQPYVKVDYRLTPVTVTKVDVLVPRFNIAPDYYERDWAPVYDSSFVDSTIDPVYPPKPVTYAKYFGKDLVYNYQPSDTPRVDTMRIGLWIDKKGKIKYVGVDTANTGEMPADVKTYLTEYANALRNQDWNPEGGGGYRTRRHFLKPSQYVASDYYCELYIIVSSKPLTTQQRISDAHCAPFDLPLNSPPVDDEQKQFVEQNKR